ncbi:MAG TPA: hypothetical protein VL944_02100 [Candidatus Acidoferrum sp.]|nr:hypothetical protein [Candidatus Acidoferrum sp.]
MNNPDRIKHVAFGDDSIYRAFIELKEGRFEEKQLASYIQRAIDDLKEDPFVGGSSTKKPVAYRIYKKI